MTTLSDTTAVGPPGEALPPTGVGRAATGAWGERARRAVAGYVALTKPRIIELLLVTTVPAMVLAEGGLPSGWLVLATLVGGALAAGSANSLNCYFDRDIDVLMRRTARRPLATAAVAPTGALVFGVVLGVLATGWLVATTNALAAALAAAAILFYVFGYTLGLKRRTPANIVWGGAAGCVPVLVGWAAVTGTVAWPALVLFAVVFFWTPPHFWALAMRFRADYAAAGVPMLPVRAAPVAVTRRILGYSWVMVAVSMLLLPAAGIGPLYAVGAGLLGAGFLRAAHRMHARVVAGAPAAPMRVFHYSISYLALLFALVAVDVLLPI